MFPVRLQRLELNRPWLPFLACGALAAGVTMVLARYEVSIPGLAMAALLIVGLLFALLWLAPATLLATPALIIFPIVGPIFPYEIAFMFLLGVLLVDWSLRRDAAFWQLDSQEVIHLWFCFWCAFTGFWVADYGWFGHGMRRVLVGWLAYFAARRIARRMPRRAFEAGLLMAAIVLPGAALVKRLSFGFTEEQAALRRALVTDLGWGTANYIATLMLLLSPVAVEVARRRGDRLRFMAWPALAMVAYMQGAIASRAAGILWLVGTAVQWIGRAGRARWITLVSVITAVVLFLVSPIGQSILLRFTSPRELGSMAVRVWYWRVAWQRILDHFPWGMGMFQGFQYPDRLHGVDPHNYWLAVAYELGVPGLVLWILVLAACWKSICRMAADPEWAKRGHALQVMFWMSMLHTLVEPTFQGAQYQYLFFWILGGWLGYFEASRAGAAGAGPSNSR